MPRIISLIASATEIVAALGFKSELVGRSHECDFPSWVKKLPVCSEPNFDVSGSSLDIDQRVKSHLAQGLSIYKVDTQLIESLKPDVIITQSHCDVCAVSQKDLEREMGQRLGNSVKILSLSPKNLDDIWTSVEQVADVLGVPEKGKERADFYRSKIKRISENAEVADERPTVAAIEWIDPLMSAGNWVPELVERAGGKNLFGTSGVHSPYMTYEQLIKANPDIIVVLACGFDIERSRDEMTAITTREGWYDLKAVHNNRVFLTDGNQYFNRPGPRMVESLEILAEIFHPELFDFGHKHHGWQYWGFNRVA